MGAIVPILLSLLSSLPGQLGSYFKGKQELEKLKVETEKAIEIEKQKLAAQIAGYEAETAKNALMATSPVFKYVSYGLLMGPFFIGLLLPELAQKIFANLSAMPEWYVQSFMLINFTIWGISASSPVVVSIFQGLQEFFRERRTYKLDRAAIDRKAFFAALRVTKGILTQADVDAQNKALDQAEGK